MASGVTSAAGSADTGAARVVPLEAMTGDVEFVFGHPDSVGRPFVMRIRELPGTIVPPHSHPVDEHITVVQGTWQFGFGERFDSTALQNLSAGSYAFAPAGTTMFGYAPAGAVVQVHGVGPFDIHWRDAAHVLGEAGAESIFDLRHGDEVSSPRGRGRVVAGYASGAIIQYEVQSSDGSRFMVSATELDKLDRGLEGRRDESQPRPAPDS
jgi:quercetin dioxygenase-like cupin family protein